MDLSTLRTPPVGIFTLTSLVGGGTGWPPIESELEGRAVPEGDSIRRTASALRALVGQTVNAETPHPRGTKHRLAARLDGRRLVHVEARGKNLLLTFEGDLVLRSHLRITGRWQVVAADTAVKGRPWLILRGEELQAIQWNGPILELGRSHDSFEVIRRLGPDIMASEPDVAEAVTRFRSADQARELGEVLLDQHLVAGIGNKWKSEGLFSAGLSPWEPLRRLRDSDLSALLLKTSELMRVPRGKQPLMVYRRAGRPCCACGGLIRSRAQGDEARLTYWCVGCQETSTED